MMVTIGKSKNSNLAHQNNKKGFTLIELLAVIVILAVIALIATPIIMGVISDSKKNAAKDSVYGYVKAVELAIAKDIDENSTMPNGEYSVSNNTLIKAGSSDIKVTYKGTKPITGTVTLTNGIVTNSKLKIDNFDTCYNGEIVVIGATCIVPSPTAPIKTYTKGEVIYFNPETNTKCNKEAAVSFDETKKGCMKWYVYKDEGASVRAILDHNTTANNVAYNSTGSNTSMKEVATALASDTASWNASLNPRLISADEIAAITGNTSFIAATSTSDNWFYFDTNIDTASSTCKNGNTNGCKYGWLYDRTFIDCKKYGCLNNSDKQTSGYWTSSPCMGSSLLAWDVTALGALYADTVESSRGVRPVVTILKSELS